MKLNICFHCMFAWICFTKRSLYPICVAVLRESIANQCYHRHYFLLICAVCRHHHHHHHLYVCRRCLLRSDSDNPLAANRICFCVVVVSFHLIYNIDEVFRIRYSAASSRSVSNNGQKSSPI